MKDDFYIGWEDQAPARHARAIRRALLVTLPSVALLALGFALAQRLIGVAFFEWGNVNEFGGILRATPYPHLILEADGTNEVRSTSAAPLVAPFKFGVKHEAICGFDGQRVTLRATRIHRDRQLMLEVEPGSIHAERQGALESTDARNGSPSEKGATTVRPDNGPQPIAAIALGRRTFRGEIVDSKCWMGVMNPGVVTTHRACAVRCISGGIPPMLLVRRAGAPPLNLLLVSTNDQPVNAAVLDFVAEPVEVAGEVVRHGALLTFRIDPATIRRLPPGDTGTAVAP